MSVHRMYWSLSQSLDHIVEGNDCRSHASNCRTLHIGWRCPLSEDGFAVPRRLTANNVAGWDEWSILQRCRQDAVFLSKEQSGDKFNRFRARLSANKATTELANNGAS